MTKFLIYKNEESSQTKLEAKTAGDRSKDRKIQMTVNKEIYSIEKSTTNLDLARDRQINERLENMLSIMLFYRFLTAFFISVAQGEKDKTKER